MSESPELVKININFYEESSTVQGIIFKGQCPAELSFDHCVSLRDLPCLDQEESTSHLIALLYETAGNNTELSKLGSLTKEGSNYSIALLSEPNKDFGNIYIIAHSDDKNGLGKYFSGAKFGLFQYQFHELLGENIKNYISFIRVMKIAKSNFIKVTQDKFKDLEERKEEKKHFEEMAEYLTKRSTRLKDELETAKQAIQQLNYQLDKKRVQLQERQEQSVECLVCKSCLKDVIFLPCGHIVICRNCMIETMGVTPDSVILRKDNPIKCPLCKNPVRQSKRINY